jgi:hypothetical protein
MMEIITRAQAKARGLKRYFTGEACKRGHVAERSVASHGCMDCAHLRWRRRRAPIVEMMECDNCGRAFPGTNTHRYRKKNGGRIYCSPVCGKAGFSESAKARWAEPGFREKRARSIASYWESPEGEQHRQERSKRANAMWDDPTFREQHIPKLQAAADKRRLPEEEKAANARRYRIEHYEDMQARKKAYERAKTAELRVLRRAIEKLKSTPLNLEDLLT